MLQKWQAIIEKIAPTQQQILAAELSKIIPLQAVDVLDGRATWAYNFEKGLFEIHFHIKVQEYRSIENKSLSEILAFFVFAQEIESILEKFITESENNYQLVCRQAVFLENGTAFLRFSITASLKNSQDKLYHLKQNWGQKI